MLNINQNKIDYAAATHFSNYEVYGMLPSFAEVAQHFYNLGVQDTLANANQFLDPPAPRTEPQEPNYNG